MSRLADLIGAIVGTLTIIGFLWRIAWRMGQLVQKLTDHMAASDRTHADQENRIRTLERRAPVPKRGW